MKETGYTIVRNYMIRPRAVHSNFVCVLVLFLNNLFIYFLFFQENSKHQPDEKPEDKGAPADVGLNKEN